MKNLLRLITDAAKNDDMNRVIELAEKQQDKFCDNNCVWTDHHPECVRAEPEWYHVIDVHGCNRFYHRTEDCLYKVKTPLYTTPYVPEGRQQRTAAEGEDTRRAWVGLTDEEINDLVHSHDDFDGLWEFADAVEAKLKAKNERLEENT